MKGNLPKAWLAEAAQRGDADAVDALAKAWLPIVYAWCHRLGGPGVDAEDAAHEALIAMCRNLPRLHAPEAFPSWMFGIVRGVLANHRRRAWFRRWMPSVGERASSHRGPDRDAESKQAVLLVWKVLGELSESHREVIVLCDLEERTAVDVSEVLGLPVGTVKSRLRLAREAFRAAAIRHGADQLSEEPAEVEVG